MTLRIGRTLDDEPFTLPVGICQQASAIHGVRGKGKTVTATVLVEEALENGIQVVVIDPTDVWWGLKSSADGSEEGYPVVILGGTHGDLPLTPESGAAVADLVVDHGISAVLSLRHMRKAGQKRFVADFAEQLYHRKGEPENRTAMFLVFDEASRFIPQRVQADTARMVGAIEDLVRLGRSSGFGIALVDQRPASVNKDALTQVELLVCHAVTSPQDRKALDEWIKGNDSAGHRDEFLKHLASLDRGEAWFWHPIDDVFERVQVRMRDTFDSSKTPALGETPDAPTALASIDIGAIEAALADVLEERQANDPKALRARIRELEEQLAAGNSGPSEEEIRIRVADAQLAERAKLKVTMRHRMEKARRAIAEAFDEEGLDAPDETSPPDRGTIEPDLAVPETTHSVRETRPHAASNGRDGVSRPQQRILDALATYEGFGDEIVDRTAAVAMAGYKPGSGHVNNVLGQLRTAGLVDYPEGGSLCLTASGRALSAPREIRSLSDVHDVWLGLTSGPGSKLLRALIDVYPDALTRAELADATGYSAGTGHFNNVVGRLSTLRAVTYPRKGEVRASPLLFPAGLRRRR